MDYQLLGGYHMRRAVDYLDTEQRAHVASWACLPQHPETQKRYV